MRAYGAIALLVSLLCTAPQASAQENVAHARQQQLRRGINLSHWFAQVIAPQGYTEAHFRTHATADDVALIRAAGFDHVRLSVNPAPLFNARRPEQLPADYLRSPRHRARHAA